MPSLKFNQLLLLSNSTKSGNQFKFSETLNLITAQNNSVGKSTLLKMLLWGLGCEPYLDTKWNSTDCKVLVKFSIGDSQYQVMRYGNVIFFKENDSEFIKYSKITGEYAVKFSEIVKFKALLQKRNSDLLETPPPAYYFVPFYLDQKKSWVNFWDNFDLLQQYDGWKTSILNYHIGLYTEEYFELLREIADEKSLKKAIQSEIDRMETTLEVVSNYVPETNSTLNEIEFEEISNNIKDELNNLITKQENIYSDISKYESEKAYLVHQKNISLNIISELESDYQFTIENLPEDEVECPLCGIIHENSIVNRASILTDKYQAEDQLKSINKSLGKIQSDLIKTKNQLQLIKNHIKNINDKYNFTQVDTEISLTDKIERIASKSLKKKVEENKNNFIVKLNDCINKLKKLDKEKRTIITDEAKEEINNKFFELLSSYVHKLAADGINLSEIKSPQHFNKIFIEGGAADGIRATLAYYISIYKMSDIYCNQIIPSLLIDTPNQQDQSEKNYDKIIEFIMNPDVIPNDRQIILATMDNIQLKKFKDSAKVILLDENQLLSTNMYDTVKREFDLIDNL